LVALRTEARSALPSQALDDDHLTYIDPESDLVKAVLVEKATRLAAAGLEQLLDEAVALGASAG